MSRVDHVAGHCMNIKEAISYFGSARRLALAIGVTASAVSRWVKENRIPYRRQIEIESATGGDLVADREASDVAREESYMRSLAAKEAFEHCSSVACARCGATPAYPVVWSFDDKEINIQLLCEACDELEIKQIENGH